MFRSFYQNQVNEQIENSFKTDALYSVDEDIDRKHDDEDFGRRRLKTMGDVPDDLFLVRQPIDTDGLILVIAGAADNEAFQHRIVEVELCIQYRVGGFVEQCRKGAA